MLEEIRDLLLQSLRLAGYSLRLGGGRSTALQRRLTRGQIFADLGPARRIALVSSLTMWNSQIWCGTSFPLLMLKTPFFAGFWGFLGLFC